MRKNLPLIISFISLLSLLTVLYLLYQKSIDLKRIAKLGHPLKFSEEDFSKNNFSSSDYIEKDRFRYYLHLEDLELKENSGVNYFERRGVKILISKVNDYSFFVEMLGDQKEKIANHQEYINYLLKIKPDDIHLLASLVNPDLEVHLRLKDLVFLMTKPGVILFKINDREGVMFQHREGLATELMIYDSENDLFHNLVFSEKDSEKKLDWREVVANISWQKIEK